MDDGKKFTVIDVIVAFSGSEGFREVGARVQAAI